VDLLQRVAALRRGVDVGMGGEQLFGEAFALGAGGEQVLARFVAFSDADMELRGKALERFARAADFRARGLRFLGGGGQPGFLLAQLAREPGDLREGAWVAYRRDRGGNFVPATVKLGSSTAGLVIIAAGLAAGDVIALRDPGKSPTELLRTSSSRPGSGR